MEKDETIRFVISHDAPLPSPLSCLIDKPLTLRGWKDSEDSFQEDLRLRLWEVKTRLDSMPEEQYNRARSKVFPLAAGGGRWRQFTNRAGFKLLECMSEGKLWELLGGRPSPYRKREREEELGGQGADEALPPATAGAASSRKKKKFFSFADLCGGPGSFSQSIFCEAKQHHLKVKRGYGLTLKGVDGLDWYSELVLHPQFTITYGIEGTGNIFLLPNIDSLVSVTGGENRVQLVVADGGFHVTGSLENHKEAISSRITYAQWLATLKLLAPHGCSVLKLFDSFTPLTRSLLYLSTFIFREVLIIKPAHSRVVNSERYLVCVDYNGLPDSGWLSHLERCFAAFDDDIVPEVIPAAWMADDVGFSQSVGEMNTCIASRQIRALERVIAAAESEDEQVVAREEHVSIEQREK